MITNPSYQKLEKHFRKIRNLQHLGDIASWDEAVMMPAGGGESRAEALTELRVLLNEMLSEPRLKDWLSEAQLSVGDGKSWQAANLREMRREVDQATALESDLVEAKTRAFMLCEQAWREKRSQNDWAGMLPLLQEVVNLVRKEAEQRSAQTGLGLYDSLMDLYEPGMRSDKVDQLFGELRLFLPPFIEEVMEKQKEDSCNPPSGPFAIESQKALGLEVMKILGFDFHRGRLDVSHHPFCGGVPHDVRLTTRYQVEDMSESLMSVLHETGHANYDQGLPQEWVYQPVGASRSMGIHESQSLLFEMQVGRSHHFLQYLSPILKQFLAGSEPEGDWSPDNLYRWFTRVRPDYIRVQADEVTYPAHVILRYEIEKALVEGQMEVSDLPEAWDDRMRKYLGLSTEGNYKDGPLQDVHWMGGAFGYFPTYTLGAMNAAQIFQCILRECDGVLDDLARGDLSRVRLWLSEAIWSQGSYFEVNDLMRHATGEELNPKHFERHLTYRYLEKFR
ncbi:MAG: carboxypeptidase M32 [Bdellovibrionales bacterium]|nr:carboxypeptidase M32 [Bdellovibrionales bacterium]